MLAVPVHGGAAKMICTCASAGWSSDGRVFYVESAKSGEAPGKTLAIPVRAGKSFPDLPVDFASNAVARTSARWIEQVSVSPGATPSIYVFTKRDPQRNLFRIPIHGRGLSGKRGDLLMSWTPRRRRICRRLCLDPPA